MGKGKCTYKSSSLFAQANFLLLDSLRLVEIRLDVLHVRLLLGIGMAGTIGSYESLYVVVPSVDGTTTFLDNAIFGLDFFEQMRYFGGQICDYRRFNRRKKSTWYVGLTILHEIFQHSGCILRQSHLPSWNRRK